MFGRARRLGDTAILRGYSEVSTTAVPVADPGDPTRTLDVWYEVSFERDVSTLEECVDEVRRAISAERYIVPAR